MPETPEYSANQGTPDALPKGGAKAANDALAASPQQETTSAAGTAPGTEGQNVNLGFRNGPPREPSFRPQDEEMQWLFAANGQEPDYARTYPAGQRIPPPKEVYTALPLLRQAAADPNAPEGVRALYRVLTYHLGQS